MFRKWWIVLSLSLSLIKMRHFLIYIHKEAFLISISFGDFVLKIYHPISTYTEMLQVFISISFWDIVLKMYHTISKYTEMPRVLFHQFSIWICFPVCFSKTSCRNRALSYQHTQRSIRLLIFPLETSCKKCTILSLHT